MKLTITSFVFSLVLLLFVANVSYAQQTQSGRSAPAQAAPAQDAPLVPQTQQSLPFGQSHYYTVTLRGNGEAVVSLKTVFSNSETAPLEKVTVTFPAASENIIAYQVIREPQCIQYLQSALPEQAQDLKVQNQNCAQYQQPDYRYGWGQSTYKKADVLLEGTKATISLPVPLKQGSSGSLVFSYAMPQVASKDMFGAYTYHFETVKVADTIQDVQVGLMTDPDYYLKDVAGNISYQTKENIAMSAAMPMQANSGISSTQFDQFYNQIGQGSVVKMATNLQPQETFIVKGSYADNKIKLYGRELSFGIGTALVVIALAFGIVIFSIKKLFKKPLSKSQEEHSSVITFPFLLVIGLSFGASLFILLYTGALYGISSFFGQIFPYYSGGFMYPLVFLLLAVISLCIYSVGLFLPGLLIGIKRGVIAGVMTIVLTIGWLVLYSIIIAGLVFVFFQNNPTPPIYPVGISQPVMMKVAPDAPNAAVGISE